MKPAIKSGPEGPIELLEFANQRRRFFFDPRMNATMVWVSQGDFYVTQNPNEVITTVLGSCIAVCARDPELQVGGMNHFLLPKASDANAPISNDLRYGSYSIERLINSIMSHGGRRDRLEIKIFGGAMISSDFQGVGHKNAEFVEHYLEHEGLAVKASDLRGTSPRRLMYFPKTGKAMVSMGREVENRIFDIERKMLETQIAEPKSAQPVLF